jgi:hypothetical protein
MVVLELGRLVVLDFGRRGSSWRAWRRCLAAGLDQAARAPGELGLNSVGGHGGATPRWGELVMQVDGRDDGLVVAARWWS